MSNNNSNFKKEIDITKVSNRDRSRGVLNKHSISDDERVKIDEYYYVIETIASVLYTKKKLPPTIDYNDLISVGFDGLVKAIRGFDESKNAQFKTYANIRVRGEMLDAIRKEWRSKASHQYNEMVDSIQERVSQVLNNELEQPDKPKDIKNLLSSLTTSYVISLETVMDNYGDNVADSSSNIEKSMDISDEYNMLNSIIGNLVKEDQDFIDMFYRKGFSQRQISAELNISEATVSRMHSKIIGQLKEKIKNV